ncbi:hypothetical protein [Caldilinea sp.]|uniref:hypothetical protein n=1 Tax=Caldilinea sp. TaxID=2293560 RepID=UPI002CFBB3F9|nr:hypothetical protein [Anaerolineales bacterium]HQY92914.1 hypothetical protein [Caldilinea sp.]HRA68765.1 hypothetical protein [Caldilinea sp.]
MAYTLSDPFRSLRVVLRLSGAASLLTGLIFLLLPDATAVETMGLGAGPLWPLRLAGAALLTLGIFYLLTAGERIIRLPALVTVALGNGLPSVLVVTAYLQQQMAEFTWPLQGAMLTLFVIWLTGAVAPLRFLRAEYQAD